LAKELNSNKTLTTIETLAKMPLPGLASPWALPAVLACGELS
jgi:hypothetical protein